MAPTDDCGPLVVAAGDLFLNQDLPGLTQPKNSNLVLCPQGSSGGDGLFVRILENLESPLHLLRRARSHGSGKIEPSLTSPWNADPQGVLVSALVDLNDNLFDLIDWSRQGMNRPSSGQSDGAHFCTPSCRDDLSSQEALQKLLLFHRSAPAFSQPRLT